MSDQCAIAKDIHWRPDGEVDDGAKGELEIELPDSHLCREFPDNLLEYVLKRHQPLELAILVDDQPEALPVGLELLQLRK